MNPIDLEVLLYEDEDKEDVLEFKFDESAKMYMDSDTCQADMKSIFSKLIKLSINYDVTLKLTVDKNYSRRLYIDVCEEYIESLQEELDSVRNTIQRELSN